MRSGRHAYIKHPGHKGRAFTKCSILIREPLVVSLGTLAGLRGTDALCRLSGTAPPAVASSLEVEAKYREAYALLPSYFTVELYSSSLSLAWLAAWSSAAFALVILPVINCSIAD